jgi:hypothetical protein
MEEIQAQDLPGRLRAANDTFISLCCQKIEFLGKILKSIRDLPDLGLNGILFMDLDVARKKNGKILTKIRIAISC